MVIKEEQLRSTVGYRCPRCMETVLSGVGIFHLSGDLLKLKCACGESEALIERRPGGEGTLSVTVPCPLCKTRHRYSLGRSLFARPEKEAMRFPCPHTGVPALYLGGRKKVVEAVREDTEALTEALAGEDELWQRLFASFDEEARREQEEHAQFSGFLEVARYMLVELQEEGLITCGCAEKGEVPVYDFALEGKWLRVFCEGCHREARLPLGSTADAQRFLALDFLLLE